jgi:hypothetical protein
MIALLLLLLVVLASMAFLMPLLFGAEVYRRRRGAHSVTCPENQRRVSVEADALHCAATAVSGTEYLRLSDCTRWPAKRDCDQACVDELIREKEREETPQGARLAHLPVVVGAALAWLLGAVWYAPPLFGRSWMQLQGLDAGAAHWRAKTIFPYLVVLLGFFVLGYTIEWMVVRDRKGGLLRGAALGAVFCLAYVATDALLRDVLPGPRMPITWIEAAYLVCGGALCGAIVSGWATLQRALTFS